MKKLVPAILLAVVCIALVVTLRSQRQEIARLTQKIADMEDASLEQPVSIESTPEAEQQTGIVKAGVKEDIQPLEETAAPAAEREKENTRRIMRDMAKTIDENPTINKMVEAGQRGAVGALYADMIEYLGLDAEETKYFMDLLMHRQMTHVEMHMKTAAGNLTEEEKRALREKTRLANETTRSEMENFLNDPEDFKKFKYYEDTIGERMMLSQMDQKLGEEALSEEIYRDVLDIMYEERENYVWSTDLHDKENTDLSPERFFRDNVQKHMADLTAMGELMDKRMQDILTPEQLAAWRESGAAMQALIGGQLIQAQQAFGGE